MRGTRHIHGTDAGVFSFDLECGRLLPTHSFRVDITMIC